MVPRCYNTYNYRGRSIVITPFCVDQSYHKIHFQVCRYTPSVIIYTCRLASSGSGIISCHRPYLPAFTRLSSAPFLSGLQTRRIRNKHASFASVVRMVCGSAAYSPSFSPSFWSSFWPAFWSGDPSSIVCRLFGGVRKTSTQ